jgi:hypothetical protein
MDVLKAIGFLICVLVMLSFWGCFPDGGGDYEPSDEYRMDEVERKYQMLENNQNW